MHNPNIPSLFFLSSDSHACLCKNSETSQWSWTVSQAKTTKKSNCLSVFSIIYQNYQIYYTFSKTSCIILHQYILYTCLTICYVCVCFPPRYNLVAGQSHRHGTMVELCEALVWSHREAISTSQHHSEELTASGQTNHVSASFALQSEQNRELRNILIFKL